MSKKKKTKKTSSATKVKKPEKSIKKTVLFSGGLNRVLLIGLLSAAFIILLIVNAAEYLPFIEDDALISLRYAKRLLAGEGLTWTSGRPVEGYSNLLWILAVSFLSMFGPEPLESARILGYIFMSGTLAAPVFYFLRKVTIYNLSAAIAAAAFIAFSGPFAVWTIGGLEQPLLAFLLSWGTVFLLRNIEKEESSFKKMLPAGLLFGLAALTRPDGIIFPVAYAAIYFVWKKFERNALMFSVKLILLPVVFYICQLIFRLLYYGEWVPNTALVKITLSAAYLMHGLEYLLGGFVNHLPLFLLGAFSLIILWQTKRYNVKTALLLGAAAVWIMYIIFIGGDIFPAKRHFIPLILLTVFIVGQGISSLSEIKGDFSRFTLLLLLPFIAAYAYIQYNDGSNLRAKEERWEYEGKALGLVLKKAFSGEQPLAAVTSAGCIPYWSELPSLDMLGLNDYYLPRHPPKNIGRHFLAHDLGDADYILKRKPDIVIFNMAGYGKSANLFAEIDLYKRDEFRREYKAMNILCQEPHRTAVNVFFRKYSPKIGIRRAGDTLIIPGFTIANNPEAAFSMLNSRGELVCVVNRQNPAYLKELRLEPGRWKFTAETNRTDFTASVMEGETRIGSGKNVFYFDYTGSGVFMMGIWGDSSEPVHIKSVYLIRQ